MRQRLLPLVVLTAAGLSLMSCGENSGEQSITPEQAPAQVIETLPVDDLAGQIEEMPDGIHLRPGVDIWEMAEPVQPFIITDPHNPVVTVLPPAFEAFEPVGVNDVVFVNGLGFMVDSFERQDDQWVYQVSAIELGRVVWGNFKIPWQVSTRPLAETPEDIVNEEFPIFDEYGNIVRYEALDLVNARVYKKATIEYENPNGGTNSGSFTFDGQIRLPATMDGVFEGRIGRFNSSYRCVNPEDDYDFCIDRLGAWAQTTFSATAEVEVEVNRELPFLEKKYEFPNLKKTLADIPLGATGLSVGIETFVRIERGGKATAAATGKVKYEFTKTVPFGFEYLNKPRQGLTGIYGIPNPRVPVTGAGGRFTEKTFSLTGEIEYTAKLQFGVGFSLNAARGVAKLRGGEIMGVVAGKIIYRPIQSTSDPKPCASATVELYGEAKTKLEFEVDLRIWSWSRNIGCSSDDCKKVTTPKYNLVPPQNFNGFCIVAPTFDRLVITPTSASPPGFEDVPGYDVDSVYLTRKTGTTSRNYYATVGPTALRGRADSTCPMNTSKVAGLTGATEIGFGTGIQKGDVITVVKSNNPGACEGSGTASLSLRGGGGTRALGTFQNNISVTIQ